MQLQNFPTGFHVASQGGGRGDQNHITETKRCDVTVWSFPKITAQGTPGTPEFTSDELFRKRQV